MRRLIGRLILWFALPALAEAMRQQAAGEVARQDNPPRPPAAPGPANWH